MRYQVKVRGLSGKGMQISPSVDNPDRSCRVACQDKFIPHRFYLVNGEHGYYPYGTKCSYKGDEKRYCVNGKCLKFGSDDTPVNGNINTNINLRSKRTVRSVSPAVRNRRHFTQFQPVNLNETVNQDYLNRLLSKINFNFDRDKEIHENHIDLNNPVFVYSNENNYD
jgi:hypothetical protein